MMTLHVLGTSTSRIAFRLTFFKADFEPSVATSLDTVRSRAESGDQTNALPDGSNPALTGCQNYMRVSNGVKS